MKRRLATILAIFMLLISAVSCNDTVSLVDGDLDAIDKDTEIENPIDGDLDQVEQDKIEQENDFGSGETPTRFWFLEAEDLLSRIQCRPSELASVIYTSLNAPGGGIDVGDNEMYLNPNVSGDGYVRLDAIEMGGQLVFRLNIAEASEYNFLISYVGGSDGWGLVSLYLDDESEPILLNSGETNFSLHRSTGIYNELPFDPITYQSVHLTAGMHKLRVKVLGSNTAGYTIGVDEIGYKTK